MSCPCQTNNGLPLIADDVLVQSTLPATTCCDDQTALPSSPTDGSDISSWATDAACYNENVVLLGRVGNRLARLVGSGFIAITNGYASIVESVPLKVRNLWHRWWKSSPTATPVIGEPLNFPYQVISDSYGNLSAIKGGEYDSVKVWDASANAFVDTRVSALPHCVEGVLPRVPALELTGYVPLSPGDSLGPENARCVQALLGTGVLLARTVSTVGGTPCNAEGEATVVSALTMPPNNDLVYTLQCVNGVISWVTPN